MTQSKFLVRDGLLYGFTIRGHSGAAPAGEDVVCAAVSSAALMTVNTVTDVCRCGAAVQCGDGFLSLRLSRAEAVRCRDVLEGFRLHMEAMREQYPQYITLTIWR